MITVEEKEKIKKDIVEKVNTVLEKEINIQKNHFPKNQTFGKFNSA